MSRAGREVVTYYLEMTDPGQLRPSSAETGALAIRRIDPPRPELNRSLYAEVGGDWRWTDRLAWSDEEWSAYLGRPGLQTWVGYVADEPAGYFELERQDRGDVEIAYFGLLPRFIGRGLGGPLLTAATRRAWEMGASRVWLHTCTLDHPAALRNYRARGFRLYREESKPATPDEPRGAS
jgi:GNAT superfamily N-acetyltransferase